VENRKVSMMNFISKARMNVAFALVNTYDGLSGLGRKVIGEIALAIAPKPPGLGKWVSPGYVEHQRRIDDGLRQEAQRRADWCQPGLTADQLAHMGTPAKAHFDESRGARFDGARMRWVQVESQAQWTESPAPGSDRPGMGHG
jgi:hypothetical protein